MKPAPIIPIRSVFSGLRRAMVSPSPCLGCEPPLWHLVTRGHTAETPAETARQGGAGGACRSGGIDASVGG